jgi:hypothetical protein
MTASGTTASHYMSYMNVFFTAQKLNILVSDKTTKSKHFLARVV